MRSVSRATAFLLAISLLAAVPARAQEPQASSADVLGTPNATADSLFSVTASQSRIKGAEDAPVTIIELSDFQCPFCGKFAQEVLPALDSAYIQTGKVKLVFFNYPLPMHASAWSAAEAALCAGVQGHFWPMHDRLFAQQSAWSRPGEASSHFEAFAREMDLDMDAFRTCTREDRVAALLLGDVMQAAQSGARATPAFIINGETFISGARPFEEFQQAIEEQLNAKP